MYVVYSLVFHNELLPLLPPPLHVSFIEYSRPKHKLWYGFPLALINAAASFRLVYLSLLLDLALPSTWSTLNSPSVHDKKKTGQPSRIPSCQPTMQPSRQPSSQPTCQPVMRPTGSTLVVYLLSLSRPHCLILPVIDYLYNSLFVMVHLTQFKGCSIHFLYICIYFKKHLVINVYLLSTLSYPTQSNFCPFYPTLSMWSFLNTPSMKMQLSLSLFSWSDTF